jgi:hypothetical protein
MSDKFVIVRNFKWFNKNCSEKYSDLRRSSRPCGQFGYYIIRNFVIYTDIVVTVLL